MDPEMNDKRAQAEAGKRQEQMVQALAGKRLSRLTLLILAGALLLLAVLAAQVLSP